MRLTIEFIATLCSALFAGAALYITFVEHPVRMEFATEFAVRQWAPSYERATWMQAPLAVVSFVAGMVAWLMGAGMGWLVAAVLIGAVVPFTLIVIMPVNHRLLAPELNIGSREARALLTRWGTLHAVRTVLGVTATVLEILLVVG